MDRTDRHGGHEELDELTLLKSGIRFLSDEYALLALCSPANAAVDRITQSVVSRPLEAPKCLETARLRREAIKLLLSISKIHFALRQESGGNQ